MTRLPSYKLKKIRKSATYKSIHNVRKKFSHPSTSLSPHKLQFLLRGFKLWQLTHRVLAGLFWIKRFFIQRKFVIWNVEKLKEKKHCFQRIFVSSALLRFINEILHLISLILMFSAWKCIDLVACNVYTIFFFVMVNLTNGYVKNLSPVKLFNNDRKGSCFHFHLQTEDEETRLVYFSREKHKLLEKIQNQDTGCKLKTFCLDSKNEIIINDYASVLEVQPNFRKNKKTSICYHSTYR